MESIQPSLRDFGNTEFVPALKRRAIIGMSRWDKVMMYANLKSPLWVKPTVKLFRRNI